VTRGRTKLRVSLRYMQQKYNELEDGDKMALQQERNRVLNYNDKGATWLSNAKGIYFEQRVKKATAEASKSSNDRK